MDISDKLRAKLRALPDEPGCYMFRDRRGTIIYVGKASSLRKRVQSYFRKSSQRSGSPKLRSLVRSAHDMDVIVVRNEAEAILTEGRLIKDYKPRYNVSFRDDKRFLLLSANPAEPFPRFRLARIKRGDRTRVFGPYASSQAARAALDFIEKQYGLRKCAPRVPDAETYRHCLNDIIRFCSAPCIGKETPDGYCERFEKACAFLSGERPQDLKVLRARMEELAEAQDFERAAAVRDTLLLLENAVRQRVRIAPTPEMRRDAAREGVAELRKVLELDRDPVTIEGFDISTISGTYAVASLVCFVEGMPRRNRYRLFNIRTVQGLDDPAMMAEAIRRKYERALAEEADLPDLVLTDGGLTQVRAARKVLDELGLGEIRVAGLAKKFEDVYRDDRSRAVHLPRESRALQVLQRLRDEAHRFALTTHRRQRERRIRESVLEEVPGIGAKRKAQLLRRFGSVRRLAKAGEEEIAEVPGIGHETARAIRGALDELLGGQP